MGYSEGVGGYEDLEELDSAGEYLSLVHDLAIRCKDFLLIAKSWIRVLSIFLSASYACILLLPIVALTILSVPFCIYWVLDASKSVLSLMTMLHFCHPINFYDASMREFLSLDATSICTILPYLRVHDIGGEKQEKKTTIKSSSIRVEKPSKI
jgi:hypothetical protein